MNASIRILAAGVLALAGLAACERSPELDGAYLSFDVNSDGEKDLVLEHQGELQLYVRNENKKLLNKAAGLSGEKGYLRFSDYDMVLGYGGKEFRYEDIGRKLDLAGGSKSGALAERVKNLKEQAKRLPKEKWGYFNSSIGLKGDGFAALYDTKNGLRAFQVE